MHTEPTACMQSYMHVHAGMQADIHTYVERQADHAGGPMIMIDIPQPAMHGDCSHTQHEDRYDWRMDGMQELSDVRVTTILRSALHEADDLDVVQPLVKPEACNADRLTYEWTDMHSEGRVF